MQLGWGEWLVILAVVLLLGGARRLPDMGRALGQAVREFRCALRGRDTDDKTGKPGERS